MEQMAASSRPGSVFGKNPAHTDHALYLWTDPAPVLVCVPAPAPASVPRLGVRPSSISSCGTAELFLHQLWYHATSGCCVAIMLRRPKAVSLQVLHSASANGPSR